MEKIQYSPSESRWNAVLIVALVLLVGAVVPSPFGRHPDFGRFGPDKLLHVIGHAGLAVTLMTALGTERRSEHRVAVLAVGISTAYGVVTNSLQRWIPGRKHERADVGAGFLGSVVGVSYQYTHNSSATDRAT